MRSLRITVAGVVDAMGVRGNNQQLVRRYVWEAERLRALVESAVTYSELTAAMVRFDQARARLFRHGR